MSNVATHITAAFVAVIIATATIIPVVSVPQSVSLAAAATPVFA